MPTIDESIEIQAPAREVFAYVTDPSKALLWASNLESYDQTTPGEVGKGTRFRGVTRVAGKRVEWTSEITEFHPDDRIEIRSLDAPMEFRIVQTFEPLRGDLSRMSWHQEVPEIGGFFGKLGDAVVTRMYSRDVASNLEKLRTLLES